MSYFLEIIPQPHTCFSLFKTCVMIPKKLFEIQPCTIVLLNLFLCCKLFDAMDKNCFCIFLHGSCSHACPYFFIYNKLHLKCYVVKPICPLKVFLAL
jgi:hypothetical protein